MWRWSGRRSTNCAQAEPQIRTDMPQAAAPPRPRVVCKRSQLSGGGTASMPVREKGEGVPVRSLRVPSHVPSYPQTAAKVRDFSPTASGFTAETDWLLEGGGFEPSVPLYGELGADACDATHAAIVKPGTPDRSRRRARRAICGTPGDGQSRARDRLRDFGARGTPLFTFSATFQIRWDRRSLRL